MDKELHYLQLRSKPAKHLVILARQEYGLELGQPDTDKRSEYIRAIIRAAETLNRPIDGVPLELLKQLGFDVTEAKEELVQDSRNPFPGKKLNHARGVKLIIHPAHNQPKFQYIGHNGRAILVEREQEVTIPYQFYLVLVDAKMTESYEDLRTKETVTRDVPRFNMTIISDDVDIPLPGIKGD